MDKVARMPQVERSELFTQAADQKGMVPAAIEKDFWVCWVLKKIYGHTELSNQLLFKGGTSLSKCFGLIERFSEDIDLILDWNLIASTVEFDADRSNTKQDKFNKEINKKTHEYIDKELIFKLREVFGGIGELVSGGEDLRGLFFRYPRAFGAGYIRPEILLEFSPMSAMTPKTEVVIQSYAAQAFPQVFEQAEVAVHTIAAKKTFWDKITILHVEAHRPENKIQQARYSRHYYDTFQMLNSSVKEEAMADLELLRSVAAFKNKFYPQGWANYEGAIAGQFKLMPAAHILKVLRTDYEGMKEMIHGNYPSFDEIMGLIGEFEIELNEAMNGG